MTKPETNPVVLVGVDGSQSSKDALRWAANYAELTGGRVRAVTTYEPEYYVASSPNVGIAARARDNAEKSVNDVLGANPSVPVAVEVVSGHPAEVLVEASRSADLLVVGSRGHGAFAGMFLGSVSNHCVHHSKCPVLVIHDGQD
ncbi:universal stress protein [Mycobacterium sp. 141]|uniref:universal stress protein n=1 Tax=Mycobacterium sp. 141 TaxID=1120797 RepID=UPI00039EB3EA|nr:universal stress protein [Mycobacterium sp. 141]